MDSFAVPVAALIVSLATLVFSAISTRNKATVDYAHSIEARLERAELALDDCRRSSAELKEENYKLMTKVMELESKLP